MFFLFTDPSFDLTYPECLYHKTDHFVCVFVAVA
jgi:hypothetical protein